jgi:hypothetical protein
MAVSMTGSLTGASVDAFRQFVKAHRGHPVLSVYVGGGLTDPSEQRSWLVPLRQAVRRARAAAEAAPLPDVAGGDGAAFAACEQALLGALPAAHVIHNVGGWCALLAAAGNGPVARFTAALATPVPTRVHWQAGAVVLPFLAAASDPPVLVLQLEHDHARLLRVVGEEVAELAREDVTVTLGAAAHMGDAPRPGFHPGTRGEALTDLAQRRTLEARRRLLTEMLARAEAALPAEGVLLIGGAEEVGRHARGLLPPPVAARTAWNPGLRAPLPDGTLARVTATAAAALRDALHVGWVDRLREEGAPGGHGALGTGAVRQALAQGAVERLLLSDRLAQRDPAMTETMAREATLQGAAVVVLHRGSADHLDSVAGGVAARLRFPATVPTRSAAASAGAAAAVSPTAPSRPLAGGPA